MDHSRKVEEDTVILSNVKSGSSAVYQCNASNEFGYLMANAFVSVLGEFKLILSATSYKFLFRKTGNHQLASLTKRQVKAYFIISV